MESRQSGADTAADIMSVSRECPYETGLNSWFYQVDQGSNFQARLAGRSTFFPLEGTINEFDSLYPRSTGVRSSIAVQVPTESETMSIISTTATEALPPLTRGSSSASLWSADTDLASALDGGHLLESQDGVLIVPDRSQPNADLLCPFQILDCEEVFSDTRNFKTHVFSHFRPHQAPKTASCFLCDRKFAQTPQDHQARAWNEMLSHLADDHFRQGQRLATVRTDFYLMRWLYSKRIITNAQFKRTQLCPVPTVLPATAGRSLGLGVGEVVNTPAAPMAPQVLQISANHSLRNMSVGTQNEAFTENASRRVERRRMDATRQTVRVRGHL